MTDIISKKEFDDFKAYARLMLHDLANAKVVPYCNNPRMQEAAVAWAPDENENFGDYPRENLTHYVRPPHLNPLDADSAVFKKVAETLLAGTGLSPNREAFVSASKPGTFACNMRSGYEFNEGRFSPCIFMFFIRANADLQPALDRLKTVSDADLHSACLGALKKCNIALEEKKKVGVVIQKRSNDPAL